MSARRTALGALAVLLILLGGAIGLGTARGGWDPVPKLALDLEGGTQVVLRAKSRDGAPISAESMDQARQIISQRINAMGVAETEISVQGGTNIVVDVPGKLDQKTSDALRQTAAMSFRPVIGVVAPEGTGASDGGASDAGSSDGKAGGESSKPGPDASQKTFDGVVGAKPSDAGGAGADGLEHPAWAMDWATPAAQADLMEVDCTKPGKQQERVAEAKANEPVVVCDPKGTQKFLLGPEVVSGAAISDASVGADTTPTGQSTGYYLVNMSFQPEAGRSFGEMTKALHGGKGATDMFAIVLDGLVISAPRVEQPSPGGSASISGDFSHEEAAQLANQLKFGALPLEFDVASEQQISATLGTDQLEKGLIAGLIGLGLVVLYAFAQYRVLSLVTTSSLVLMGAFAYGVLTVMSNIPEIGYRLSLAGVVGLIVSIAFTADSFIVYFERVRDEIRDGRGIVAAVDHGWSRAKRTILASDAVNVIAAVVLYVLSTGGVRGFAFTLGLATLLDLMVVFLFTHPLLQALVRTRFFGKGHPWSGLDPAALGRSVPAYAGRGRVRTAAERGRRRGGAETADSQPESLAERKARLQREAAAQAQRTADPGSSGPAGAGSAGADPVGADPMGSEPASADPSGDDPAGASARIDKEEDR